VNEDAPCVLLVEDIERFAMEIFDRHQEAKKAAPILKGIFSERTISQEATSRNLEHQRLFH
jgi:type IV secretory pathway VirJ component